MTTEDTRKDKRAKIVSLNVRYKSATVDEFIENHSHDVSKGGLFIKTPTPFPPGTLIKFEIRIAGDKPVIMGVGRVVWKREPSQAGAERPSGMGVKFIKIDDSSRHVIERVVAEKEGAGAAYATESEDNAARTFSDGPPDANSASMRPATDRKETFMGIGASVPPQVLEVPSIEPPAAAGGMFPKTAPEAPKKEQTVMKQAAELLEEALKEAGGSMDEIGNNPLFAEGNRLDPRVGSNSAPVPSAAASGPSLDAPIEKTERKRTLLGVAPAAGAPKVSSGGMKAAPDAKLASDPPKRTTSGAPAAVKPETSSGKTPAAEPLPSRQRATDPPARKVVAKASAALEDDDVPAKKSGGGMMFWLAVGVVVLGGAAFLYKDNLLAGSNPVPPQTATSAPTPPPAPAPSATEPPSVAATASAVPSASSAPSPSASAAASAKPAPSASAAPVVMSKPAPAPPPPPAVTAAAPPPKPKPAPKPVETSDTPPPPKPKPAPKPKPTADDSDNPY